MTKTESQIHTLAQLYEVLGRYIIHCELADIEVIQRELASRICETYRKQVFDVADSMAHALRAVAAAGITIKPEWVAPHNALPLSRVEVIDNETASIRRLRVDCTWAVAAQRDIVALVRTLEAAGPLDAGTPKECHAEARPLTTHSKRGSTQRRARTKAAGLTQKQKAAVDCRDVLGMSLAKIAKQMGISKTSAAGLLKRADERMAALAPVRSVPAHHLSGDTAPRGEGEQRSGRTAKQSY